MSSVVSSTFTLLCNHRHWPSTDLFSSSAAQCPCVSEEIPLLSSQWGSQKPHSHLPWDWDAGLWPGSTRQMHPCGPCCRWEPQEEAGLGEAAMFAGVDGAQVPSLWWWRLPWWCIPEVAKSSSRCRSENSAGCGSDCSWAGSWSL